MLIGGQTGAILCLNNSSPTGQNRIIVARKCHISYINWFLSSPRTALSHKVPMAQLGLPCSLHGVRVQWRPGHWDWLSALSSQHEGTPWLRRTKLVLAGTMTGRWGQSHKFVESPPHNHCQRSMGRLSGYLSNQDHLWISDLLWDIGDAYMLRLFAPCPTETHFQVWLMKCY